MIRKPATKNRNIKKPLLLSAMGLFLLSIIALCAYHAVDNTISQEDELYIPMFLKSIEPLPNEPTYTQELNFIVTVQRSVLNIASGNIGIPYNQKREPKELYLAKTGLCYDRSRVIEKILTFSDFKTRHISIYSLEKTNSTLTSIFTPGTASHAVDLTPEN